MALGAYREGARGHPCSKSTSFTTRKASVSSLQGPSLSWGAPPAAPDLPNEGSASGWTNAPKTVPSQNTAPWAGQGGQNTGVHQRWAMESGPHQVSTLGGRAHSTEEQPAPSLQLWSTNAVSDSPLKPGMQPGIARKYQAAAFHLPHSPALPPTVRAAGSSSEGVPVIFWTSQQASSPGE